MVIEEWNERRAAGRPITAAGETSNAPLREILVWRMCSDPWPGGNMVVIDDWLNNESRRAGFVDWIDAYHHSTEPWTQLDLFDRTP